MTGQDRHFPAIDFPPLLTLCSDVFHNFLKPPCESSNLLNGIHRLLRTSRSNSMLLEPFSKMFTTYILSLVALSVGSSAQTGYTPPLAQACNSTLPRVLW